MLAKAGDVMTPQFYTLRPEMTITEAIGFFQKAGKEERNKVFGMVVTDVHGKLVGMLSMYDILPLMRPSNIRDWEGMDDSEVDSMMQNICSTIKTTLVGDIMTPDVITITPDTHAIKILDIMIRRHIRRLPVVDGEKMVGMVYISDIFDHLGEKIISR
jgi:CBS domain-containing protein